MLDLTYVTIKLAKTNERCEVCLVEKKIAVITTEFMADYVHSAFSKMQLDCNYEIFIYGNFKDIPKLYQELPEDIAGVLTSGSFPARVIRLSFPNTQRVIMHFNTDDAAICQLFFRLLDENRFLKFDRIYADLVEMFGIDLKTYLMHDFSTPLSITTNQMVCEKGLDEVYQIEEQEYQKHLKLWKSGMVDLCVTRFSSIVDRLQEQGVPVYFPYPSIGYLRETCLTLFKEIEYRQMQNNSSAIINVTVVEENDELGNASLEYRLLTLQAALMGFMGAASQDYFLGRSSSGIEILTNRKNIENLTENYTGCKIQSQLNQHVNFKICIGYGIGRNLQQARGNARKAMEYSKRNQGRTSFLVNEDGVMLKSLVNIQSQHVETYPPVEVKPENKKIFVPEYKIREVFHAIEEMEEKQITSQELAGKLNITKRSANRILSAMEAQGIIEVAATRPTSAKGRPERIYREIQ